MVKQTPEEGKITFYQATMLRLTRGGVGLWFRCGVDVWHLDCRAGGVINLAESEVKITDHDYIASITKKGERLELHIPPSYTKTFDTKDSLNNYLRALGLEEMDIP